MSKIGCRINLSFDRPAQTVIELFRNMSVSNIGDCMNRMAAVTSEIRPINRVGLLGCAMTVKVAAGDNLMLHKAMDLAKPGDVIVIDAGGLTNQAIFGELMASYCAKRGLAGLIVDGSIRDLGALQELPLSIYARSISPNGPYKDGPGEIGYPVSFGGIVVHPGDIIVGDVDGIIAIRPEEAEQLAKEVAAIHQKEQEILRDIDEKCEYIRPWVDQKLAAIGCMTIQ